MCYGNSQLHFPTKIVPIQYVNEYNKILSKKKLKHKKVLYVSQDTKPELAVQNFQDNPE